MKQQKARARTPGAIISLMEIRHSLVQSYHTRFYALLSTNRESFPGSIFQWQINGGKMKRLAKVIDNDAFKRKYKS